MKNYLLSLLYICHPFCIGAHTKQLQAFFTKYADDPKLFERDNAKA